MADAIFLLAGTGVSGRGLEEQSKCLAETNVMDVKQFGNKALACSVYGGHSDKPADTCCDEVLLYVDRGLSCCIPCSDDILATGVKRVHDTELHFENITFCMGLHGAIRVALYQL